MYINPERIEHVVSLGIACMVAAHVLRLCGIPWTYAFYVLWSLTVLIYWRNARAKVSTVGKAVLVTGCDSGIGLSLALRLDQLGFRVFACCAHVDERSASAQALRRNGSQRFHVLQLNFNDDLQIFEVFARVTQLLARDGRILTIGRTCERTTCHETQHYLISKAIFDAYDKLLRQQLKHRGVKVCRIELLSPNTSEPQLDPSAPTRGKANANSRYIFADVVRNRGESDVSEAVEAHVKALTDAFPLNKYFSSIPY
ncbi:D-beta-hydroxybutyrate dehydrogenase, mitochondrial-like isoform X2 [Penaeus chinensis]|uniref:D-beta-hydroxybutyrate dehydrogenase, mitochondrial-like isoform X2 n=1 Tax=Penaeus chinensis TaxID=139456 RepID=UPI001FB67878|nr:D-beta-hydroxybutyrate dehydrogenase, mitochondrial-like isoform X2 [Penaeus chinensis]